ncbi:MAG: ABC-F family ATP-binding cassette domain-containing protein [Lachnospiraceae bacterium]|nr:ABC-F family ATP-binding cassette domain-containing protein [Lachnospiraceae bacterium]
MILSCQNITKAFGDYELLQNASFIIEEREKAAIVGINGAGKSTLLKIIMGQLAPDYGQVIPAKGKTIGYLAQHQDLNSDRTIYDELLTVKQDILSLEQQIRKLEENMKHTKDAELEALLNTYTKLNHDFESANGYAYKSELTGVLKGLGFNEDDYTRPVNTLSGGQKTRVSLGKLLLTKPDILLLDEPTNHLDMESIAWLETFLLNYDGAVVVVAHDRYFLDKIVTKIIEVDQGKVTTFSGNYTDYAEKKAMLREAAYNAYVNQQREIKHQEDVIAKLRSFNREKSIKRAESREKLLNKMEVVDKPTEVNTQMKLMLEPDCISGNDVLSVSGLSKSFPTLTLFQSISFEIKRGERVALIGNNGTGKTTILKIITGLLEADSGTLKTGANVHIGYYDQEHHVLHPEKTIFEEISDDYPHLNNTRIRNVLAAFLFTGDDVFKLISELSGGERGRVSLAKLMLSEANFLILDEPTNHLDIDSKEILENALNSYSGTVLYVSHDRYFINKTATRIIDLNNKQLINYIGNYDYYLEKKDLLSKATITDNNSAVTSSNSVDSAGKMDWKQQKEEQAKQRKRENELKKVEDEIASLEERITELDELMASPEICTDVSKCMELQKEKEDISEKLEVLYEKWEELA